MATVASCVALVAKTVFAALLASSLVSPLKTNNLSNSAFSNPVVAATALNSSRDNLFVEVAIKFIFVEPANPRSLIRFI